MSFIYSLTATWNDVSIVYNGIMLDVSNGAGGEPVESPASRIFNFKRNALSIFSLSPDATLYHNRNTILGVPNLLGGLGYQQVGADAALAGMQFNTFGAFTVFRFSRANGTAAAPTAMLIGDAIGTIQTGGYDSSVYANAQANLLFTAAENWTPTARGTKINLNVTTIGSTTLITGLGISNSGGLSVGCDFDPGLGSIYINNSTFLMRNKTTFDNYAAAQVGTLNNAPTAGNPTKWISIDDNGTPRRIPTW